MLVFVVVKPLKSFTSTAPDAFKTLSLSGRCPPSPSRGRCRHRAPDPSNKWGFYWVVSGRPYYHITLQHITSIKSRESSPSLSVFLIVLSQGTHRKNRSYEPPWVTRGQSNFEVAWFQSIPKYRLKVGAGSGKLHEMT